MGSGRKCVGRFLVLYALNRPEPHLPTRAGFTASRKVGDSVARNRIRRRLRDLFRRRHSRLAGGWDLAVNARHGALRATAEALAEDFDRCLSKLGLWARDPRPEPDPAPPPSSSSDQGSSAGS
jgi:ribonuclease P protein component